METIVRKGGGVPDPDCPEDAESTRYWASVGGKSDEVDKEKQKGGMLVRLKATSDIGASLLSGASGSARGGSSLAAPGTDQALALVTSLRESAASATTGIMVDISLHLLLFLRTLSLPPSLCQICSLSSLISNL